MQFLFVLISRLTVYLACSHMRNNQVGQTGFLHAQKLMPAKEFVNSISSICPQARGFIHFSVGEGGLRNCRDLMFAQFGRKW